MITKNIKTLYGNLISVQGRYIQQALNKKCDLHLIYQNAKMIVANSQLEKPIKTTIVPDKFTGNMNKLYYYEWKPIDKRQGRFISMIDKKIFEKFNLLPFSPSRLNAFRDFPCGFVMRYIYGYDFPASPPMIRGSAIEYGFNFYFTDGYSLEQCIQKAFNYYDDGITFIMDKDKAKKERAFIEPMLKFIYPELSKTNSSYLGFQMKVSTEILGIPFSGYTDYAFENDERITVIDLKTKGKLMKKHSDMLQQAIYKKALEEQYKKPVDVRILIVTPKKIDYVDIEDTDNYIKEIEMSLISCANMIKICKEKESLSSLITPNLDNWQWSDADKRSAREVIWGI